MTKLNKEDKYNIYQNIESDFSSKAELARKYNVSPRTIGRIYDEFSEFIENFGVILVGDRFQVVEENNIFSTGSIVELEYDDGSISPLFKLIKGSCSYNNSNGGTAPGAYLSKFKLERYPTKVPVAITDVEVPKTLGGFSVGEIVCVSNNQDCYNSYTKQAKHMDLDNFVDGDLPIKGNPLQVVKISNHLETDRLVYGVEAISGQQYIVGDTYMESYKEPEGKYTLVPGSIIVIQYQGEVCTVDASNRLFEEICNKCYHSDFESAINLAQPAKALNEFTKGDVTVESGVVNYQGEVVNDGLADAILRLMEQGDEGFIKLVAFLDKVKKNPSYKSRMELFGFIKAADIEITESGDLICWKRVRDNWTDCYTGKIDNSIGQVVTMVRTDVNDDSNQTCSAGLHCCSKSYLSHFRGARVVKVLVNPEDVVSIPTDYNDAKMRTCKYVVIEEVSEEDIND